MFMLLSGTEGSQLVQSPGQVRKRAIKESCFATNMFSVFLIAAPGIMTAILLQLKRVTVYVTLIYSLPCKPFTQLLLLLFPVVMQDIR